MKNKTKKGVIDFAMWWIVILIILALMLGMMWIFGIDWFLRVFGGS